MKRDTPLLVPIAGFVSAIFLCSFFPASFSFAGALVVIAIALFAYRRFIGGKRPVFLTALFIVFFALGILRSDAARPKADPVLAAAEGKEVILRGTVSVEPSFSESSQSFVVQVDHAVLGGTSTQASGKILVRTSRYPAFSYGDLVSVSGKIGTPQNFSRASTSGQKDFDYAAYLAKDGILFTMDFARVSLISSGKGNPIREFLFSVKEKFIMAIGRLVPEPEASFLAGVILGAKSSIDTDTANAFRVAGLSHIVALSGYNVTIVVSAIAILLSFLPHAVALSGGALGVILFVLLSGSSSTAIRAGIMALIAVLAKATGRKYDALRALIAAALLMIVVNPPILASDISFQLSFLATFAVIVVSPILERKFSWVTERGGLRGIVATTVAAQILVLPLILLDMGQLSVYALPANILVLPVVPASMFFGFLAGAIGMVFRIVALPFAWISWAIAAYMIFVARFFAGLPLSSIFVPWFSPACCAIAYAVIAVWIWREQKKAHHA
ncbi:MAG: ComEC family competence protein [Patescibacteria group bacterium]|nr:ComEC/Rec2 family competence protein [Patescibacteria group bacterium]MDE1945676.1 ComEC family competence protein [Patescibacteria group bacterium]